MVSVGINQRLNPCFSGTYSRSIPELSVANVADRLS